MYNLNSSSVTNSFIKQLLTEVSLPNLTPVAYGDYILSGVTYLYNHNVIRCTKSGIISDLQAGYLCSEDSICNVGFICGVGFPIASYDIVEPYLYSGLIPGKTSQFHSTKNSYDMETHTRLGEFLRWYRSAYGVNLMGLYNCFYPQTTDEVSFTRHKDKLNLTPGHFNKESVVYKVPVRFNTSYSVYFTSTCTVNWSLCFMRNGDILRVGELTSFGVRQNVESPQDNLEMTEAEKSMPVHNVLQASPHRTTVSGINRDILVATSISDYNTIPTSDRYDTSIGVSGKDLHFLQEYLCLILEVPRTYRGNIVILEDVQINQADTFRVNANLSNFIGEGTLYKENKSSERVEHQLVDDSSAYRGGTPLIFEKVSPNSFINELRHFNPPIKPSLLNSETYEPFSKKLVGYLVEHTITSQEDVPKNVQRVQDRIGDTLSSPDVWGEFLLPSLYRSYFSDYNASNYDVLGYVDKDVEGVLFN